MLYELYADEDALAHHNEQTCFKDVVVFVGDSGAELVVKKASGKFMTD